MLSENQFIGLAVALLVATALFFSTRAGLVLASKRISAEARGIFDHAEEHAPNSDLFKTRTWFIAAKVLCGFAVGLHRSAIWVRPYFF